MSEEIELIIPPMLPFGENDKIFYNTDEETGDPIGEPYSYNDSVINLRNISGINEELLGAYDPEN